MSHHSLCQLKSSLASNNESACSHERYIAPVVDIYETEEGLTLLADVPGMDETTLQISVDQGVLTLEGKVSVTSADSLYHEFSMAGYWRQFQISKDFDVSQATAEMKDGVLTLTLPKAEAAKARRIAVSVH